jgi:hypothetical protein
MEYLLVIFPVSRGVSVDGLVQGRTNIVFELDAGDHDVTLEAPHNFSPPSRHVVLRNTAELDPCRIRFELLRPPTVPQLPRSPA